MRGIYRGFSTRWASARKSRGKWRGAGSRCGRTLAKVGLAAGQKKATRSRASIAFIDETGFRLQPVNRRTWALTGVTPVQRAWDRYDRLNVIGAVALSPTRSRISTPFQVYEENIRAEHVVYFIQDLRKRLRRPLIICLDRWSVHRSAARQIKALAVPGVQFEWLPAYAPNSIRSKLAGATSSTPTWRTSCLTTSAS